MIAQPTTMQGFARTIATGVTAFAATNLDDIVILMLFFAQIDQRMRPRHIVAGQYVGFAVLILASLPGFLGGFIIPRIWLGLLGLLPIAIGISHLLRKETEDQTVQTVSGEWLDAKPGWRSWLKKLLRPQIYQVAAVTIANGGDNIAIYVPLFASSTPVDLGIILAVFLVMIALWCLLAYQLSRHPLVAQTLMRYGHYLVPFVLIGLGTYILLESGAYQLLGIPALPGLSSP